MLHIRMVTVIQSVCPSTEIKFGKHFRCFEVGSVILSGKCGAFGIKTFCFPVQKGHNGTTVCGLEDRHFIESLSTYQLHLNPLRSTRQYGFPPQQFNDGSGSGMSNGW